ncbi:MAG: AAA family ATPase [Bacteroidales bacterium]|nr:AAA family ATPase [Bacteroidales bacterium]
MKENEHLIYFKVENFKRFEEFELKDITQFNIIVGDNNVGKTSLLEALLFSKDIDQQMFNLLDCFRYKSSTGLSNEVRDYDRTINQILPIFFNDKKEKEHIFEIIEKGNIDKNIFRFEIKTFDSLSEDNRNLLREKGRQTKGSIIILYKNNNLIDIKSQEDLFGRKNNYFAYIPFSLGYDDDLTGFYSNHIQHNKKRKEKFVNSIKSFIPDIQTIELTTRFVNYPVIEISETTSNELKLLSTYGDGAVKLFRILSEIIVNSGQRLMIDEIDTGIHYSRFEEFWKIILKTAKEYDVQIFATTHNPDCLKYLVRALENENMKSFQKETSVFALDELPDKSIKSFKYDYETFSYLTEKGIEFRGGKNE